MALKNTYTQVPAIKNIGKTQDALVKAGASGVQYEFNGGRVTGLSFKITIQGNEIGFRLPVRWENFQKVLAKEGNKRAGDDEYAYRVAWACTKDWIEAQMAFIESENVTLPQVFLPYAVTRGGETLFEKISNNPNFLLGDGN